MSHNPDTDVPAGPITGPTTGLVKTEGIDSIAQEIKQENGVSELASPTPNSVGVPSQDLPKLASINSLVNATESDYNSSMSRQGTEIEATEDMTSDAERTPEHHADADTSESADTWGGENFPNIKPIKYLKKADGEPFWRKDVQHDFLKCLFEDDQRVFTNNFEWCEVSRAANHHKLTFAELYLRTMVESHKCSKILRERLIGNPELGLNVSKLCFLVNAGRINTTVNFLPETRPSFRTFHPVPCLQSDQDGPVKVLQDTPRLKAILKSVCETDANMFTLLDLIRSPKQEKPNTNVFKVIYLLSTFFQNIPFHYDDSSDLKDAPLDEKPNIAKSSNHPSNKFMEFFTEDNMCPKNRAQRFLWLVYTYLETSFTQDELEKNPYNPKHIPPVKFLTQEEIDACDIDLETEKDFAKRMCAIRTDFLDLNGSNFAPRKKYTHKSPSARPESEPNSSVKFERSEDDNREDTPSNYGNDGAGEDQESAEGHRNGQRFKRKKPTASVGALIEFSKNSVVLEGKWNNPEFPIRNLEQIKKRFNDNSCATLLKNIPDGTAISCTKRKQIIQRNHQDLTKLASTVGLNKKMRDGLLSQMRQYFEYKKDSRLGLLGIEWEDIRSDLVNGVEAYLYQQLGKTMLLRQQLQMKEEDRSNGLDSELARKDVFANCINLELGDLAPEDLASLDRLGAGCLAEHDYDRTNERSAHDFAIIEIMTSVLLRNIQLKSIGSEACSFDLVNGTMLYR
ncbi:hypothetical protein PUMCH_003109 [Australozyma saopauloensis]|uniref:Ino eighty subunit 1 n=1 Tax=Australozyma saopauloensis TaxID=291208 RepID=A0AAX4HB74_9ASCO|nr:hypothetical protein PUMCH_003109 [[Candida] saopauloensis]